MRSWASLRREDIIHVYGDGGLFSEDSIDADLIMTVGYLRVGALYTGGVDYS